MNDLLPKIARPVFERYGFASAEILSNWAAYAGCDFASCTAPEKMTWPRPQHDGPDAGGGATLILRVSGARALEVQHKVPVLIERINASFGYRAIGKIRLLQAPLPEKSAKPAIPLAEPKPAHTDVLSGIENDRLRAALLRIAAGLAAKPAAACSPVRTQN